MNNAAVNHQLTSHHNAISGGKTATVFK